MSFTLKLADPEKSLAGVSMKRLLLALVLLLAVPAPAQETPPCAHLAGQAMVWEQLPIAGWRIYYGDSSTSGETRKQFDAASEEDVQVVVVFYHKTYERNVDGRGTTLPYRFLCHSQDYYWWGGCGGAEAAAKASEAGSEVKRGKWVFPDGKWVDIYNKADQDMRAPR